MKYWYGKMNTKYQLQFLIILQQGNSAKFLKAPEAIEFGAYKNKLRFTSSAVETLEVREVLIRYAMLLTNMHKLFRQRIRTESYQLTMLLFLLLKLRRGQ